MGCLLGCFGGAKEHKRRKQKTDRISPQRQRNKLQNVQQENIVIPEQITKETITELRTEPEVVEQASPSPKRIVTYNSNMTTFEHVSVHESVGSLPDCTTFFEKEKQEDPKILGRSNSSVASYPPNHRYHNARYSDDDDEAEEYGDNDPDNDSDDDDEYFEDADGRISSRDIWSEPVLTESVESTTRNSINEDEVRNPMMLEEEITTFGSKNSAAKSKGIRRVKPQKENLTGANSEPHRISFSSEPTFTKISDRSKNPNQELSVDASLSNWLASPEITPSKKTSFSGFETKTSRSPDDMPIIGTIGTYWNRTSVEKNSESASSFKGIQNTTSKYREDKRVNWHSTPFETRLDKALSRGAL